MIENNGILYIAMSVAFVFAAILIGRGLFRLQIFPKFNLKDYVIGVIAGTIVIWAVLNVSWLGWLAGAGLIALLIVPRLLRLKPIRLKLPF